jgi:hypothetical protein
MLKNFIRSAIHLTGFDIRRRPKEATPVVEEPTSYGIPDEEFYEPVFSPWKGYGDFANYYALAEPSSLVSPDRCYILLTLAKQASRISGTWMECGVYRGGTAAMFAKLIQNLDLDCTLHLFDTFEGMPETNPELDLHQAGDFEGTSLEDVKNRIFLSWGKMMSVSSFIRDSSPIRLRIFLSIGLPLPMLTSISTSRCSILVNLFTQGLRQEAFLFLTTTAFPHAREPGKQWINSFTKSRSFRSYFPLDRLL